MPAFAQKALNAAAVKRSNADSMLVFAIARFDTDEVFDNTQTSVYVSKLAPPTLSISSSFASILLIPVGEGPA